MSPEAAHGRPTEAHGRSQRRHLADTWLARLPQPPAGADRQHIYDTQLKSFGVTLHPSGKKSFFLFRRIDGRPVRIHIGAFPALSVKQARAIAHEKTSAVESGRDPRVKHGLTVEHLFRRYLDEHLRVRAKNPEYAIYRAEHIWKNYFARWRTRSIESIRRPHVRQLHAEAGEKHGKVAANRAVEFLRAVIGWCIREELFDGANPADHVKGFPENERERFLRPHEAPAFFAALRDEPNRDLRDFIWLALMTGARKNDILSMRWRDLDLQAAEWRIPNPKSGQAYTVALMPEALKVLATRLPSQSEFVFPGDSKSGHLLDPKRSWNTFRKRAGLLDVRVHDLRRSLGSWMAAQGESLPKIGRTLGHRDVQSTQIYARINLDSIRESVSRATRALLAAGEQTNGN